MMMLKVSCLKGNEMAVHTKHYGMKLVDCWGWILMRPDCKAFILLKHISQFINQFCLRISPSTK